jgi:hypothetical protein
MRRTVSFFAQYRTLFSSRPSFKEPFMMDQIFQLSSLLVMPFWAIMIFLPHWRWTRRTIASPLIALPAALLYAALFLPQALSLLPALMDPSLAEIGTLLGTPTGATIAWIHFLAFDLFVGRWVYLDARQRSMTAWLVSPILFFVLMAGPLGFTLYLGARALAGRMNAESRTFPAAAKSEV